MNPCLRARPSRTGSTLTSIQPTGRKTKRSVACSTWVPGTPTSARRAGRAGSYLPTRRGTSSASSRTATPDRRLTTAARLRQSLITAATGRRAVEHPPQPGVPLAKEIRLLGRQCHRPPSNTASLGDEGVKGRLVRDQGRQLQEGCTAPRRGDRAALHRSADGSQGSRCANAPRASP